METMFDPAATKSVPCPSLTDDTLHAFCTETYALAQSTLLHPLNTEHPPWKLFYTDSHNLTIHSSRSEVLQDPAVRAAYLKASTRNKRKFSPNVVVKCGTRRKTGHRYQESQSQYSLSPGSKPSCQSERDLALLETQDPKNSATTQHKNEHVYRQLEWIWTGKLRHTAASSKTLHGEPDPNLQRFPGDVIIDHNSEQARLFALMEDAPEPVVAIKTPLAGRTAFWTDASCPVITADDDPRHCGIAVVHRTLGRHRRDDDWIVEGHQIPALMESNIAETLAVCWSLVIAKKRCVADSSGDEAEGDRTMVIYSDCKVALQCLRDIGRECYPTETIGIPIEVLDMTLATAQQLVEDGRIRIELRWVLGHRRVPVNELADEVAKQAATGKPLESRARAIARGKPIEYDREVIPLLGGTEA